MYMYVNFKPISYWTNKQLIACMKIINRTAMMLT